MAEEYLPTPQTDLPTPEKDLPPHATESVITRNESPDSQHHSRPKLLMLGSIVVILIIGIAGAAYFMGKNSSKQPSTKTKISSPSPASNPMADWKTYSDSEFSVKYDPTWQVNADNDFGATSIFDPKSWSEKPDLGDGVSGPSEYFTVQIIDSPLTVKQYVDKELSSNVYLSVKNPERQNINLDNYSGEIFKNSGEGSEGYIVALSNGDGKFATINIPYSSPSENKTIWNMLNSFEFTNSSAMTETSDWKTYTSSKYGVSLDYPSTWKIDSTESLYNGEGRVFSIYENTPGGPRIDFHKNFQGDFCNGSQLTSKKITINGTSATRYDCEGKPQAINYKFGNEKTENGDYWLVGVFVEDQNANVFEKIFDSFKIN